MVIGLVQVDVLDRVHQCGAVVNGALEGLTPKDEALAAGALVDDGRAHRTGEVVAALGFTAGVDQPDPSGVAVDDLPTREVDGIVRVVSSQ